MHDPTGATGEDIRRQGGATFTGAAAAVNHRLPIAAPGPRRHAGRIQPERRHAMADGYTKVVLTAIAAALVALAIQNAATPASAIGEGCGENRYDPCYVAVVRD